ncbi:MAG TPA: MFS transporter [Gemmataceae bacterium]|jgi:MFS family permease
MGTLSRLATIRRPTHVRFGVLAFACSLSLLTYLDRICIMRAKENMRTDLGFDEIEMGWIFSAFTLGYMLFEVPGGWMGDIWGSRRVLTRIVLCWSLFTALTGCVWSFSLDAGVFVLNSLTALLLVRFLFGVGEAGAYPNLTRVVGSWFPFQERAFAQGAIWMCARLGGAFAPVIIGRLSAALGWRQAFWVLGAAGVSWCVVFWMWFRDTPEEMPSCNEAERDLIRANSHHHSDELSLTSEFTKATYPADTDAIQVGAASRAAPSAPLGSRGLPESGHAWPPWRALVFSLTMWSLCATSCFVCFGWYFYPTWQPRYLKDVYGISYDDSELLTGLPFLCGALGSLLGGSLSDILVRRTGHRRWGRSLMGVVGFSAAGLCVLGTGFTTTAWQAVALLCLAFLVNDLAIPVIWAVCADVGGRYAGTVSGIMNMAGGVGAVLSPVLIPSVLAMLPAEYSGSERWRLIFAGLAVSWFVGALAWIFIDASKPLFSESMKNER